MSEPNLDNFTEEEMQESAYLAEAEEEKVKPKKKTSVKAYFNPVAFKEDISINMVDLDNAFIQQAAQFAHYAMQMAKANEQVDNFKLLLDVKEAQLNTEYRNSLAIGGVKVTELMLCSAVTADPRYIRVHKAYNEAKTVFEMLKAATEAFRQRRDMLIQVGTNDRQERKGELFIKSKEVESARQERINKRVAR